GHQDVPDTARRRHDRVHLDDVVAARVAHRGGGVPTGAERGDRGGERRIVRLERLGADGSEVAAATAGTGVVGETLRRGGEIRAGGQHALDARGSRLREVI